MVFVLKQSSSLVKKTRLKINNTKDTLCLQNTWDVYVATESQLFRKGGLQTTVSLSWGPCFLVVHGITLVVTKVNFIPRNHRSGQFSSGESLTWCDHIFNASLIFTNPPLSFYSEKAESGSAAQAGNSVQQKLSDITQFAFYPPSSYFSFMINNCFPLTEFVSHV